MAKEKDFKKEGSMKNAELLNSEKDTQQERLARGAQRVPKEGQTWTEINNQGRRDVQKPGSIELNKDNIANNKNDKIIQVDMGNSQTQDVNVTKAKENWDKSKKDNPETEKRLSISHDQEVKELLKKDNANKDINKSASINNDLNKKTSLNEPDRDKD